MFGVFLNSTRKALVRENLAIDIVWKSGARGRNQYFYKISFNYSWLVETENMEVVHKAVPICGHLTYSITASWMISGLVLK